VKPTRMEIHGGYRTKENVISLVADQSHAIVCRVFGSDPPANVSWWRANKRLVSFENTTEVYSALSLDDLLLFDWPLEFPLASVLFDDLRFPTQSLALNEKTCGSATLLNLR